MDYFYPSVISLVTKYSTAAPQGLDKYLRLYKPAVESPDSGSRHPESACWLQGLEPSVHPIIQSPHYHDDDTHITVLP